MKNNKRLEPFLNICFSEKLLCSTVTLINLNWRQNQNWLLVLIRLKRLILLLLLLLGLKLNHILRILKLVLLEVLSLDHLVPLKRSLRVSLLLHRLWLIDWLRQLIFLWITHNWDLYLHWLKLWVCSYTHICHRYDNIWLLSDCEYPTLKMLAVIILKFSVASAFATTDNVTCCSWMYVKASHHTDHRNHKADNQEGCCTDNYYAYHSSTLISLIVLLSLVVIVVIVGVVVVIVTIVVIPVIVRVIVVWPLDHTEGH